MACHPSQTDGMFCSVGMRLKQLREHAHLAFNEALKKEYPSLTRRNIDQWILALRDDFYGRRDDFDRHKQTCGACDV
jgi:hypothetical protein